MKCAFLERVQLPLLYLGNAALAAAVTATALSTSTAMTYSPPASARLENQLAWNGGRVSVKNMIFCAETGAPRVTGIECANQVVAACSRIF